MYLNTRETYGLFAQILHWITAGLILTLLPLGLFMDGLPQGSAEEVARKAWFFSLHKTLGVTAFCVAILRILWAVFQPHPLPLITHRPFEQLAAHTVHWILYAAIIFMPLTGWLYHSASEGFAPIWWPFFQDLPLVPKDSELARMFGAAHFFTGVLLLLAVALHIAGALKHALLDSDRTLQRMLPGADLTGMGQLIAPSFKGPSLILALVAYLIVLVLCSFVYFANKPITEQARAGFEPQEMADSGWVIVKDKSRLDIEIMQMGNPIAGGFAQWQALVQFDPQDVAAARIQVDIDVNSITLGGITEQAKGENFLNTVVYPTARFESDEITETDTGHYNAAGHLTLVGQRQPLTFPFQLRIENDRAFVTAEFTIERLQYGIGATGFSGEEQLGFGVVVRVYLEADKAP